MICLKGDPKEQEQQCSDVRLGRVIGKILRNCLGNGRSAAQGTEGMRHHRYSIRSIPEATTLSRGRVNVEGAVKY